MTIEEEWKKIRKAFDDAIERAGIKCPEGTIPVKKFNRKIHGIWIVDETRVPIVEIECQETMKTKA